MLSISDNADHLADDRYLCLVPEFREILRTISQYLSKMPKGTYDVDDHNVTSALRAALKETMDAFIHHFKLFLRGLQSPAG
jgi:NADH:ubiquinone oxidoreductase subunit D